MATDNSNKICRDSVSGEISARDKQSNGPRDVKSKYVYYDYKANQAIPESHLGRTLYFLERKRKSSLNRLHQTYLATKEELKQLEIQKSVMTRRRRGVRRVDNNVEETERTKKTSHKSLPDLPSQHIFRLESTTSMLSDRQKSAINQRSFEHLKSKYRRPREIPSYHIQYPVRTTGRTKKAPKLGERSKTDASLKCGLEPHEKRLARLNINNSALNLLAENTVLSDVEFGIMNEEVDPDILYSFSLSASVNLPPVSTSSGGELVRPRGEGAGRAGIVSYDGIKSCRYIRGFEPAYMRTPRDINKFIFRSK